MVGMFDRLTNAINKFLWIMSVICLLGVVLFCFLQVFTRFVTKSPILGAEEMARLFFVWMVYCGSGLCTSKGTHAAITIFQDMLSKQAQLVYHGILQILVLIFTCIVLKYGWVFVQETKNQFFGSIRISIIYANSSILMCGFSIFINSLNNLVQDIATLIAPDRAKEKNP
jgi:TRAP-type C4-dicarboxylate transport system permease small subunit